MYSYKFYIGTKPFKIEDKRLATTKFFISNTKIDNRKYSQINIYTSNTEKEKVSTLNKVT